MRETNGWLIPAFLGGFTCMTVLALVSFISCYGWDAPALTVRNESGAEITVNSQVSDFEPETIHIQDGVTVDVSPRALELASHIDRRSLSFLVQGADRSIRLDVSSNTLTKLAEAKFELTVSDKGVRFKPISSAPAR